MPVKKFFFSNSYPAIPGYFERDLFGFDYVGRIQNRNPVNPVSYRD